MLPFQLASPNRSVTAGQFVAVAQMVYEVVVVVVMSEVEEVAEVGQLLMLPRMVNG